MPAIPGKVLDDREPVSVFMKTDKAVVVMDEDDYAGIMETLHLLGNPVNAERLMEGVRWHKDGVVG